MMNFAKDHLRDLKRRVALATFAAVVFLLNPIEFPTLHGPLQTVTVSQASGLLFAQSLKAELRPESSHEDGEGSAATADVRSSFGQGILHTTPFKSNVDMVTVYVTVTGAGDRTVTGLDRDAFAIFDNRVPQQIAAFSTEDTPVAVGIVLDSSGSMIGKMDSAKKAALQFIKTANAQDRFVLVKVGRSPEAAGDFGPDSDDLQDRILAARADGRTALIDSIYLGVSKLRGDTEHRKALLVISDGGDNESRYSQKDLRHLVEESDVQIYAVGLFEPPHTRTRTREEANGPLLLADIAKMSGGTMFTTGDLTKLPDIMDKISRELRSQYALAYLPSNLICDGSWRHVRVRVNPPQQVPHLHVAARSGYYAPTN